MSYILNFHFRNDQSVRFEYQNLTKNLLSQLMIDMYKQHIDYILEYNHDGVKVAFYMYKIFADYYISVMKLFTPGGYGFISNSKWIILTRIDDNETMSYIESFNECGEDNNKLINLLDRLKLRCDAISEGIAAVGVNTAPISKVKRSE